MLCNTAKRIYEEQETHTIYLNDATVPVTKSVYQAYRRSLWREHKQRQACRKRETSLEKCLENREQFISSGPSPEKYVEEDDLQWRLYQALAGLSFQERFLICELYLNGKTEREVADALALSHSAVHKQKVKILHQLKESLLKTPQGPRKDKHMKVSPAKRGEIYLCPIDTKNKFSPMHPVLILENQKEHTVGVAFITKILPKTKSPTLVLHGKDFGLAQGSVILAKQIEQVNTSMLSASPIGTLHKGAHIPKLNRLLSLHRGRKKKSTGSAPLLLCLCPRCRQDYLNNSSTLLHRADPMQTIKEPCCHCQMGMGYDYLLQKRA